MATARTGYYDMKLKLPEGLTCTQCVLQWKYHCGKYRGSYMSAHVLLNLVNE